MAFMEWTDKLDIGVDAMNDQHKGLINCMNKLHELNEAKSGKTIILAELTKLAELTVKHFADEEAYMEKINFPSLTIHQGVHKKLLDRVGNFIEEFKSGSENVLSEDFFDFLQYWLKSHIQGTDIKYGQHKA